MDCRETKQLLSAYMDGQLEKARHEAVLAHLERCAGCRAELEELRQAVSLVRRLPELSPPPEFRNRLRQRIAAGMKNEPKKSGAGVFSFFTGGRRVQIIALAAAICMAAGITALWQGFSVPGDRKEMVQNITEDSDAMEYTAGGVSAPAAGTAADDRVRKVRENNTPGDAETSSGADVSADAGTFPAAGDSGDKVVSPDAGTSGDTVVSPDAGTSGDTGVSGDKDMPAVNDVNSRGREEVSMMSVPPTEEEGTDSGLGSFSPDPEQELLMAPLMAPSGMGDTGDITADKPGTIHVTALTLETGDLQQAKEKIKQIAEKYDVQVINEQEKSFTLVCPVGNCENILTEINTAGSVTDKQSWDQNADTGYDDICSQLTRLYAEELLVAHKKELTSGDNELLKETGDEIENNERQWQQIESIVDKHIITINLKPF